MPDPNLNPAPGHVKIALTSNDLIRVDANFQVARQVVFYDVTEDSAEFLDCAQFKGGRARNDAQKGPGGGKGKGANGGFCWMEELGEETTEGADPLAARIDALEGCGILFTRNLSDPAAVRVYARKIFPVKMETSREIDEVILSLQQMMARPPLWLKKALGLHVRNPEYQV
jgi:nitrogen fixation protein NifX